MIVDNTKEQANRLLAYCLIVAVMCFSVAMFAVATQVAGSHAVAQSALVAAHSGWYSSPITYTSPTTVFPADVNQDNVLDIFALVIGNSAVLLLILLGFAVGVFGLVIRAIRRARSA